MAKWTICCTWFRATKQFLRCCRQTSVRLDACRARIALAEDPERHRVGPLRDKRNKSNTNVKFFVIIILGTPTCVVSGGGPAKPSSIDWSSMEGVMSISATNAAIFRSRKSQFRVNLRLVSSSVWEWSCSYACMHCMHKFTGRKEIITLIIITSNIYDYRALYVWSTPTTYLQLYYSSILDPPSVCIL